MRRAPPSAGQGRSGSRGRAPPPAALTLGARPEARGGASPAATGARRGAQMERAGRGAGAPLGALLASRPPPPSVLGARGGPGPAPRPSSPWLRPSLGAASAPPTPNPGVRLLRPPARPYDPLPQSLDPAAIPRVPSPPRPRERRLHGPSPPGLGRWALRAAPRPAPQSPDPERRPQPRAPFSTPSPPRLDPRLWPPTQSAVRNPSCRLRLSSAAPLPAACSPQSLASLPLAPPPRSRPDPASARHAPPRPAKLGPEGSGP